MQILSVDLPIVRRWRRRIEVWWGRRRGNNNNNGRGNGGGETKA